MRLKIIFLFVIMTGLGESISAQDHCLGLMWDLPRRDSVTVFSPKAFVRSAPGVNATILDSLPFGVSLKVIPTKEENLKLVRLSGYDSYWIPVQYKINNTIKEGFVWSGALSIATTSFQDKKLMVGMGYVTSDSALGDVVVKYKLLDNYNKELWSEELEVGKEAVGLDAKLWNGMGLSQVQNVVRIMSSGEACGVPTDFQYYAWMGDAMVKLPKRYSVSDAGVYYYDETFIFPSEEGGKPDQIIKHIASEEFDENDKPIKKTKQKIVLNWDANLRKVKQATSSL